MKSNSIIRSAQFLALSLLFPFLSAAQSFIGVQAGLNWSNVKIKFPEPFSTSPQNNYFLGLTNRVIFGQNWANNTDLQFTQRKFFIYVPAGTSVKSVGFRLGYIDLASNIEYTVFKNFSLQLGAYAAYRITEALQPIGSESWSKFNFDLTSKGDMGLLAGISARFQCFTTFVRYTHGLTNINRVDFVDENGRLIKSGKIFNQGIQIGLGYRIANL